MDPGCVEDLLVSFSGAVFDFASAQNKSKNLSWVFIFEGVTCVVKLWPVGRGPKMKNGQIDK